MHSDVARETTFSDYSRLARRRWKAIALGVLIGVVASGVYMKVATPTYVALSKVLVNGLPTDSAATGQRTASDVNLDTEAQLVVSTGVAERVKEILNSSLSTQKLASNVTVTVPPNSTVLNIAYSASTASAAQDGSAAFANAYVFERNEGAQKALNADISQLQATLSDLSQRVTRITGELNSKAAPPSASDRTRLLAQRQNINLQFNAVSATLSTLRGTAIDGGDVIVSAPLPKSPTSPSLLLVAPSGLMLGLLLGLGFAFARQRLDPVLGDPDDLRRLFRLPVIAQADLGRSASLVDAPAIRHEMRATYHALAGQNPEKSLVSLVVATDSRTADQLAGVLSTVGARAGSKTALVVTNAERFASIQADVPELEVLDYAELEIVVDGNLRPHAISSALGELRQADDLVVLGSPTDDWQMDLPALGHIVDVVIVVVELGTTKRDDVASIVEDLRHTSVSDVIAFAIRRPAPAGAGVRKRRSSRR